VTAKGIRIEFTLTRRADGEWVIVAANMTNSLDVFTSEAEREPMLATAAAAARWLATAVLTKDEADHAMETAVEEAQAKLEMVALHLELGGRPPSDVPRRTER
jgi:hypothetical protein